MGLSHCGKRQHEASLHWIGKKAWKAQLRQAASDSDELRCEWQAIDGVHDVILFEDIGNSQTKLTFIGNETMQNAIKTGQLEGMKQILDKVAAVVAGVAKAK